MSLLVVKVNKCTKNVGMAVWQEIEEGRKKWKEKYLKEMRITWKSAHDNFSIKEEALPIWYDTEYDNRE